MDTIEVGVRGMTCAHCVNAVTEEVGAVTGVETVTVDLQPEGTSTVTITATAPVDPDALAAAVAEAGYEVADLTQ